MAVVAPVVATEFATPNGPPWTRVAVGAAPGKNVTVGALDDGEGVTGALVCHVDCLRSVTFLMRWVCSKSAG